LGLLNTISSMLLNKHTQNLQVIVSSHKKNTFVTELECGGLLWFFFVSVKSKDFFFNFLECIFVVCTQQMLANLFVYQIYSDPLVWSAC